MNVIYFQSHNDSIQLSLETVKHLKWRGTFTFNTERKAKDELDKRGINKNEFLFDLEKWSRSLKDLEIGFE